MHSCSPCSGLFRVEREDPTQAQDLREASPCSWAENADIPFLVTYGERDYDRIVRENLEFIEALGGVDSLHVGRALKGLDHYGANLCNGETGSWWTEQVREFIGATS